MLRKSLSFLVFGVSMSMLAGCVATAPGAAPEAATVTPESDPALEATVRKAAVDAEGNYNYGEAAQHYATLLQKHPEDQDLILATARNLRYSGAPQRAIDLVNQRIVKAGPKEPLLIELGKGYLAADQLNLAVSVFQQARSLDPNNWQILSALAVAQDYQGNYKEAQETYQAALKLAPNNPVVLNNYALSLAQTGQLDTAIATLQTATGQPNVTAQTRQNLALMLALKGDKIGAERLVRGDLPPDMAQNNVNYYQSMDDQSAPLPATPVPAVSGSGTP